MPGVPTLDVRAATEADYERIAEFLADDEERLLGRPGRLTETDVRAWLADTDLPTGSWLFERDGRIAALAWVAAHGEVGVSIGVVHEEEKGRGLGSELLDRTEAALADAGVARIHAIAFAVDERAAALLAGRGYREVRRFWEMTIDLAEPPAPPKLPAGLRIEAFDGADARAFYDALDEAFQDHWEHHSRPFEEWWEQRRRAPDFDPSVWFLARDGDEVAAVVRNDPNRSGGGWVGALGVRRRWRGRGLGRALLLHTFGELHRRGITRVGLGVDAANPTGATRLYESVGMSVDVEQVVWEKRL